MGDRAIVIETATGVVRRQIWAQPTDLAANVGTGESLFLIVGDDGAKLDDANLLLDENGDWAEAEGAPEGLTPPSGTLQLVAL